VQLEHSFSVPVSIDEAWKILLDIERIGPCMPGAVIDSVDGDDFTGTVKVKLGPINLSYKGKASFVEKDETARRAVIDARGRDARGNGTAAAKVIATLSEADGTTTVQVNTDLDITGKPAQFGRGVMVDVGNKLLGQFADALAATIKGEGPEVAAENAAGPAAAGAQPAAPTEPAPAAVEEPAPEDAVADNSAPEATPAEVASVNGHRRGDRSSTSDEVEPIDLLKSAGPAVGKRLAGPLAVALVIALIAARRRRRR
jgi:carbon monoxide dehydrogenase subunit G